MLFLLALSLFAAEAKPLAAPEALPEWVSARVWPDEAGAPVAIAERYGEADPGLGAHRGLHFMNLDGCWRQHAAYGGDLATSFCADLRVKRNGRAKARVTALSDPRPGLEACIDVTFETWAGVMRAPGRGEVCREVHTNISREAGGVWTREPWAEVGRAGRMHLDADLPIIEVGRAKAEHALMLQSDPASGGLVRVVAPIGARDRASTTARRLVTDQREALEQCWRDHAHWRPPDPPEEGEPLLAFTLEVTVGPAGAESVVAGRTAPVTHADMAQCVAAALNQDVPPEPGDRVIEVPVVVMPRPESTETRSTALDDEDNGLE
ncbi:MAG: hypothetical protein CL927_01540 [Deltaproteobacteria bacterium]|nr:hypothetical protein [Deltaproteobacteria bacterium]HCH62225.1 hypothetical protein [Deltaproteobacteria bacterium]